MKASAPNKQGELLIAPLTSLLQTAVRLRPSEKIQTHTPQSNIYNARIVPLVCGYQGFNKVLNLV